MTLEVDPVKLWETAYINLPDTAQYFANAATRLLDNGPVVAEVTNGGDTAAAASWGEMLRLTGDIVGTTSVNLDQIAVALASALESYVDQDGAAEAELNTYLDENEYETKLGDEPSRVDGSHADRSELKTETELDKIEEAEEDE